MERAFSCAIIPQLEKDSRYTITINKCMSRQLHHDKNYGGARPGAGRPKGSTNRITMEGLLASLDQELGRPYAEQVAINYVSAINRADWGGVRDYDRVLLGKVIADRTQVETIESSEQLEQRQQAFAEALAALAGISNEKNS